MHRRQRKDIYLGHVRSMILTIYSRTAVVAACSPEAASKTVLDTILFVLQWVPRVQSVQDNIIRDLTLIEPRSRLVDKLLAISIGFFCSINSEMVNSALLVVKNDCFSTQRSCRGNSSASCLDLGRVRPTVL